MTSFFPAWNSLNYVIEYSPIFLLEIVTYLHCHKLKFFAALTLITIKDLHNEKAVVEAWIIKDNEGINWDLIIFDKKKKKKDCLELNSVWLVVLIWFVWVMEGFLGNWFLLNHHLSQKFNLIENC
jgi:hypothetical protein